MKPYLGFDAQQATSQIDMLHAARLRTLRITCVYKPAKEENLMVAPWLSVSVSARLHKVEEFCSSWGSLQMSD